LRLNDVVARDEVFAFGAVFATVGDRWVKTMRRARDAT
jgi:hypothetical protein